MSYGNFTEYSNTGERIRQAIEVTLLGIEKMFDATFKEPPHDIALKFLNHICEFESEAVQDQRTRERAAKEVRDSADKSRG